ncbi:GTPase-activating protein gyp7 isoform X2 [Quercus robur]|uniref:GTPase-activating protein gyp7 isoform X2 n=1 Tax=Quercus robur TaxID=38942 RepID=UPI002161285A|nr:GTPase-activating protein gyp7 isoform X2 [Quercus robur]
MMDFKGLARHFMKKDGTSELDVVYPIKSECQAEMPKTGFKLRAGKTLSARRWYTAFSQDGHLDIEKVLRRIQRGGVHPAIKGAVWEFLLGCFDPNSTFEDRIQLREQHSSLDHGRHVSNAVSEKKVIQWKLNLHQIGLDVVRTDRALVFYESEANQAKLWDILAVYAWVDNDIGYVQGMSDICSPMVILLENEADAFWCFERAMRRLRKNFRCSTSSVGVQAQLSALSQIIKVIDPKLHQHLEDLDGGEYLFAFRMLMVLFRREFSFVDSLYLWELMWAMEYNPNIFSLYEEPRDAAENIVAPKINEKLLKQYGKFERKNVKTGRTDQHSALAVFLVASVLENKNKRLLKEAKGLDDVVKIMSDITGNLDAKKACKKALKIHKKYLSKLGDGWVSTGLIIVTADCADRSSVYDSAVATYLSCTGQDDTLSKKKKEILSNGDSSKISDRRSPLQGCLTLKIGNDQQHEHAKENS